MGAYKDSLPNGRNPSRKQGGMGKPQNGSAFVDHQLSHTPGGRYGYRAATKRAEAEERQAYRDNLTPEQQIANLDRRLGVGVGARKERARLQAQIDARSNA